jgi:hypothetical protein
VLPDWLQEIAALTTLALAGVWLVLRWLAIGKPRAQPGCARCEHNPQSGPASGQSGQPGRPGRPGPGEPTSVGVRSAQLRVLDS